ncbi:hypothetical protein BURMUCF2_B0574 [Burkholderia multivorans CF2]|nr:hypothetical protein BURMUCF2_B0574 [Burkholderia multivorans CF2]
MRASSAAYSPDEKQGVNIAEPLSVRLRFASASAMSVAVVD